MLDPEVFKISSAVTGLALVAFSASILWMAGSFEYRHAYVSGVFGVALLGLAFYGSRRRTSAWSPLVASAVLAAAGMAWGFGGAIETSWLLYGPADMLVNAVVETVTVVLLSAHLLLNITSSIRPSRVAVDH